MSTTIDVIPAASASILRIHGEITAASEAALMEAYGQASPDVRSVVLDFADLDYMNSGGIGLLVTLLVRANRLKQRLTACGLNEHYRQIFELTRLDEAIAIFVAEEQAVSAARTA